MVYIQRWNKILVLISYSFHTHTSKLFIHTYQNKSGELQIRKHQIIMLMMNIKSTNNKAETQKARKKSSQLHSSSHSSFLYDTSVSTLCICENKHHQSMLVLIPIFFSWTLTILTSRQNDYDNYLSIKRVQFHHLWIVNQFCITLNPSKGNFSFFISIRQHIKYTCVYYSFTKKTPWFSGSSKLIIF